MVESSTELAECTIEDLVAAMESRRLSSRELVEFCLGRIDAFDQAGPALNAIVTVNEQALAEADECDRALAEGDRRMEPLQGIPIVVKDQVETAGLRTTFGSSGFRDYVPSRDATLVSRLKE